jgi:hypothetical protein
MLTLLLLVLFCFDSSSSLFTDDSVLLSRKYDNLPWPLLNPHALNFITTHGLHCYFVSEASVKSAELNWIDELHLRHCYGEVKGALNFLEQHEGFSVPELLCPQMTGNGKHWHSIGQDYMIDYFDSNIQRMTISALLGKDPEMTKVYNRGDRELFGKPVEVRADNSTRLYVCYAHDAPREITPRKSVIKSLGNMFASEQDIALRILAGYNYGMIITKHMMGDPMTEEERAYAMEQEKTEFEWAWIAASFYCTFNSNAITKIKSLMVEIENRVDLSGTQ